MPPSDDPLGDEIERVYRKEFYRINGKTPEEEDRDHMGVIVWVFAAWGLVALGLIVYYW